MVTPDAPTRKSPMPSPRSRLRRTAVVGIVSGLALGAGAQAASAASFDLLTGTQITSGRAHGWGSLTFPNARTVRFSGKLNDQCAAGRKGDGYGAYMEFRVNFAGGGYATKTYSDERTCKAAAKGVAFATKFPKKVKSVGVTVIELDRVAGGGFRAGDAAQKLIAR